MMSGLKKMFAKTSKAGSRDVSCSQQGEDEKDLYERVDFEREEYVDDDGWSEDEFCGYDDDEDVDDEDIYFNEGELTKGNEMPKVSVVSSAISEAPDIPPRVGRFRNKVENEDSAPVLPARPQRNSPFHPPNAVTERVTPNPPVVPDYKKFVIKHPPNEDSDDDSDTSYEEADEIVVPFKGRLDRNPAAPPRKGSPQTPPTLPSRTIRPTPPCIVAQSSEGNEPSGTPSGSKPGSQLMNKLTAFLTSNLDSHKKSNEQRPLPECPVDDTYELDSPPPSPPSSNNQSSKFYRPTPTPQKSAKELQGIGANNDDELYESCDDLSNEKTEVATKRPLIEKRLWGKGKSGSCGSPDVKNTPAALSTLPNKNHDKTNKLPPRAIPPRPSASENEYEFDTDKPRTAAHNSSTSLSNLQEIKKQLPLHPKANDSKPIPKKLPSYTPVVPKKKEPEDEGERPMFPRLKSTKTNQAICPGKIPPETKVTPQVQASPFFLAKHHASRDANNIMEKNNVAKCQNFQTSDKSDFSNKPSKISKGEMASDFFPKPFGQKYETAGKPSPTRAGNFSNEPQRDPTEDKEDQSPLIIDAKNKLKKVWQTIEHPPAQKAPVMPVHRQSPPRVGNFSAAKASITASMDSENEFKTAMNKTKFKTPQVQPSVATASTPQKAVAAKINHCDKTQKNANLEDPAWCVSTLSRAEAEKKLRLLGKSGGFVIRESQRQVGVTPYSLTLLHGEKMFNLQIRKRSDNKFAIGTAKADEKAFESLDELVSFHRTVPIEIVGDKSNKIYLLHPVNK